MYLHFYDFYWSLTICQVIIADMAFDNGFQHHFFVVHLRDIDLAHAAQVGNSCRHVNE